MGKDNNNNKALFIIGFKNNKTLATKLSVTNDYSKDIKQLNTIFIQNIQWIKTVKNWCDI